MKLEGQVEELRQAGFDASLVIRTGARQVRTLLVDAAEEVEADLIVVGTHGRRAVTAAVMGSVARALCHYSGRPVLIVPPTRTAGRSRAKTAAAVTA